MKRFLVGALLTCFASSSSFAADVVNPLYRNWSQFKPGSQIVYTQKTTLTGSLADTVPDGIDEKTVTETLASVSENRVIVNTIVKEKLFLRTVELPLSKVSFPSMVPESYLAAAKANYGVEGAMETVEINGKAIACKTLAGVFENGTEKVEKKAWISAEVPGGFVKQQTTTYIDGVLDSKVEILLNSVKVVD